jgi:hypothetical protein
VPGIINPKTPCVGGFHSCIASNFEGAAGSGHLLEVDGPVITFDHNNDEETSEKVLHLVADGSGTYSTSP